jgi:hypothetical protein
MRVYPTERKEMGWTEQGQWSETAICEDAPCCGCCGPQGDGEYEAEYDDYYDGARDEMYAIAAENGGRL